jgi:hypothetical protein
MDFRPLLAETMGHMAIPGEEELKMIRSEIDPSGLTVSKGEWITVDAVTGKKIG